MFMIYGHPYQSVALKKTPFFKAIMENREIKRTIRDLGSGSPFFGSIFSSGSLGSPYLNKAREYSKNGNHLVSAKVAMAGYNGCMQSIEYQPEEILAKQETGRVLLSLLKLAGEEFSKAGFHYDAFEAYLRAFVLVARENGEGRKQLIDIAVKELNDSIVQLEKRNGQIKEIARRREILIRLAVIPENAFGAATGSPSCPPASE